MDPTGEGGGQVCGRRWRCRSPPAALPDRRASGRSAAKPGLLRQHLTAVQAATCGRPRARRRRRLGSRTLTFDPRPCEPGDYALRSRHGRQRHAGAAGDPAAAAARAARRRRSRSKAARTTRTAPPFDFLERVLLPVVDRLGARVKARLERHGFYPAGGGRFTVRIEPVARSRALELLERGEIAGRRVRALVAHLPRHIADAGNPRGAAAVELERGVAVIETVDAPGPGNAVLDRDGVGTRQRNLHGPSAKPAGGRGGCRPGRPRGAPVSGGGGAGRLPPRRSADAAPARWVPAGCFRTSP